MAVAFVQSDKNFTNSGSSCAKAFPSNNAAGNMLVVAVGVWKSTSFNDPTISDTGGNTWKLLLATATQGAGSGQSRAFLFVAYNCAAGANTVTVSLGTTTDIDIAIHEYSGCATVTARDQIACGSNHGIGTSGILAGTITTQVANEVVFSFAYDQDHSAQTYTPTAGWTSRQQTSNTAGTSLVSYDQIVSATGTFTNQIAVSVGLSKGLHAIIASFADTSTTDQLVQSQKTFSTSSASLGITFPANNTAGNLLLIAIGRFISTTLGTVTSVTDSQGNTWVLVGSTPSTPGGGGHGQSQAHLYACASCAAGANTVTVATSTAQDLQLIVAEYQPNTISTFISNSTSSGTSVASGSLSVNAGLAFTLAYDQSDAKGTYSDFSSTGWRERVTQGSTSLDTLSIFDQIVPSSSVIEQTISVTVGSNGLHVIVAGVFIAVVSDDDTWWRSGTMTYPQFNRLRPLDLDPQEANGAHSPILIFVIT